VEPRGDQGVAATIFFAYLVILCFARRCRRQNTIARPSQNLPPPIKHFGFGYTIGRGQRFQMFWHIFPYMEHDHTVTKRSHAVAALPQWSSRFISYLSPKKVTVAYYVAKQV